MEISNIIAKLVETTGEGEKARTVRHIHLTVPELGLDNYKFRPSDLQKVADLHNINQKAIENEDEEAEENYNKFSLCLKLIAEPFYTHRKSLGWDGFNAIMAEVQPILDGLDLTEDKSDPFLSAKRYAAKNVKVADASDDLDYLSIVRKELQKEYAVLQEIERKAAELSASDFTSFILEKAKANGVDEEGYPKLRAKLTPEEKAEKERKAAERAAKKAAKAAQA